MKYYNKYVPSEGDPSSRIYIVGEAPGETEHREGRPFVGESGRLLRDTLNRHGINASECFITNLCHYRPNGNIFENVLSEEVFKDGLKELYTHIAKNRPNVIVPLGNYPLKYITGKNGITTWRGSIIPYLGDKSLKTIATFHPAAILRNGTYYPTFDIDIARIAEDSNFPDFNLPERQFIINPRGVDLEEWTQKLCESEYLGCDIETIKASRRILCVGFSPSPEIAVCFSTESAQNRNAIQRVLESDAKKIFQFGTFDTLQLIECNGYSFSDRFAEELERPYFWDTNVSQHIFAPELPRSLEYLTSIYTRQPYYKTVGRASIPDDEKGWTDKTEKQTLYEYNCRDCCVTIEIALKQMAELERKPNLKLIFNHEMALLQSTRELSRSGMYQDQERRELLEKLVYVRWRKKQDILDKLVGLGVEVNVNGKKTLLDIMYKHLELPPRYAKKKITTNEDAIVSLIGFCKGKVDEFKTQEKKVYWMQRATICKLILEIRGYRVLLSNYLNKRIAEDGRVHSTYNAAGTETGRFTISKFVDGTGFNSGTLPRDPFEFDEATLELVKSTMSIPEVEDITDEDSGVDE